MAVAYSDLRAAIIALVDSVSGAGNVHNRERWADDWPTFLGLFKSTDGAGDGEHIRGWMLTRTRKVPNIEHGSYGKAAYDNVFLLRGILGFEDATDTDGQFQALIDRVTVALNAWPAGVSDVFRWSGRPASVRLIELRQFGRVLCHYTEIEFTIISQE